MKKTIFQGSDNKVQLNLYCFFYITLLLILINGTTACGNRKSKVIGVKIYQLEENPEELITKWKMCGINTAFISKELTTNDSFRNALKKNNIPFFIIWPVFQNPAILEADSTLFGITDEGKRAKDDWVEFICPSRSSYRQMQIDSIQWYIENYHPEGLSVDFIRHFVFWEMIYPDNDPDLINSSCYCDSCLNEFTDQTGLKIPDSLVTISQKARFLKQNYISEWNGYRCELITSMVKDIAESARKIYPSILINIHVVPWRTEDFNNAIINIAGQDIEYMEKYADYISPMCYSQMLNRNSIWINDVIKDMDAKAPGKILPSIQVFPYYIDDPFPPDSLIACLDKSLEYPSRGVIFWSWPLLRQDTTRLSKVALYLKSR